MTWRGVSKSLVELTDVIYLEDSPRVVLVVGNTAVTHPSVSHDGWVKASIGEC